MNFRFATAKHDKVFAMNTSSSSSFVGCLVFLVFGSKYMGYKSNYGNGLLQINALARPIFGRCLLTLAHTHTRRAYRHKKLCRSALYLFLFLFCCVCAFLFFFLVHVILIVHSFYHTVYRHTLLYLHDVMSRVMCVNL